MKKSLQITSVLVASLFFALAGYLYSNSTKEEEIHKAVLEESSRNYEGELFVRLNTSNIIYSLVKDIEVKDFSEFERKTCLYLKTGISHFESLIKIKNLSETRKKEIATRLSVMKDYVNTGISNNNCSFEPHAEQNT